MGFLDFFPCCGRREADKDSESIGDSDPLLRPNRGQRPESIISQEGYGATSMSAAAPPEVPGALTEAQRSRIDEIGRQVGHHMLPIHHLASRPSAAISRTASAQGAGRSTSSAASSRPSSPSPLRPDNAPPDGTLLSSDTTPEVVRKTVFAGGMPSTRRVTPRGRGRARGGGTAGRV